MKAPRTRLSDSSRGGTRRLVYEGLEERRLLAAGWHNPVYRLDVNNDGVVTPQDGLHIINRIKLQLANNLPPELPTPPSNPPPFYYDTNNDGACTPNDLHRVFNGIAAAPKVTLDTLVSYTMDVTPHVTVKATGVVDGVEGALDGLSVMLDVDVNGDGDFGDPGEMAHTTAPLYKGSSTFTLSTPLLRAEELYTVHLRARVKNTDAVVGASAVTPLGVDTRSSNVLEEFVADKTDYWYTRDFDAAKLGYTFYALRMQSQIWRSDAEVDKPVWQHWVSVFVPNVILSNTAILHIGGGSNLDPMPTGPPPDVDAGQLAVLTGAIVVDVANVPSEPLRFADETRTRSEDAIIAYSFDKFLTGIGEAGNNEWPVLMAMVKTAVRTMDTIQDFIPKVRPSNPVNDFLITGYSKRGWTTWLTAGVDDRVRAIIPGVFDNLNQGIQMVHHYGVYGFFSEWVDDYNEMEIFHRLQTEEALELAPIVDPYRYLNNGRYDDMPKLMLVGAGDEFFVTDSAQYYFDDVPGDSNYIRYFPNAGHGLDIDKGLNSGAVASTISFYDAVVNNRPLPKFNWTVAQDGAFTVKVEGNMLPTQVRLWQATNPFARDFRDRVVGRPEVGGAGIVNWTFEVLSKGANNTYTANVPMPTAGARAYFVELTFANSVPFRPDYVFTTDVRVKSALEFHPWPKEFGIAVAPYAPYPQIVDPGLTQVSSSSAGSTSSPGGGSSASARGAVAAGIVLAVPGSSAEWELAPVEATSLSADASATASLADAVAELMMPAEIGPASAGVDADTELVDAALADLDELLA